MADVKADTNAVSVKLPPFWPITTTLWFLQAVDKSRLYVITIKLMGLRRDSVAHLVISNRKTLRPVASNNFDDRHSSVSAFRRGQSTTVPYYLIYRIIILKTF